MRALIVEDDPKIASFLTNGFGESEVALQSLHSLILMPTPTTMITKVVSQLSLDSDALSSSPSPHWEPHLEAEPFFDGMARNERKGPAREGPSNGPTLKPEGLCSCQF